MKNTVFASGASQATASASKWAQLRTAKRLLPEHGRFHACHHNVDKRAKSIGLYANENSAWFGQVYRCGLVWICPVCSRRVAEHRRLEMQDGIDNAVAQGLGVALVTQTFSHSINHQLAPMLAKFTGEKSAQRSFKSGRAAKALRERWGFVGEIRTLEVTHGANGWHPHTHSIWILQKPLGTEEGHGPVLPGHGPVLVDQTKKLEAELFALWLAACRKHGLPDPSPAHGVDVRNAKHDIAQYVAKWGFAAELAAGPSKRGKLKGATPWQLLARATEGDQKAAALWQEFAHAFEGKKQLLWSRGLRQKLALAPELTEQELLELDDQPEFQVCTLDLDTWHVVRKADAQGEVLALAVSDRAGMYALLNHLRSTVPMEHGRPPGAKEEWIA